MVTTLRRLLPLALVAALAAGCAADEPTTPAPTGSAGGGAAAYPVTLTHKLGTTTVDKAPTRVVTLSDADLDAALLLGVQPVGIAESSGEGGITPWATPKLTGEKPKVLSPGDAGYDVEEVLALNPDVILAGGDYYIADQWSKYSAVVPTTAFETGAFEDPWQTTLRQVGKVLGKSELAETIIREVEGQIAKVKIDNPTLDGKTFSLSQAFEAGSIGVLRSTEDTGVKMLNDFGMKLSPTVAALPGTELSTQLSLEKLGVLDADVVLVYYLDPALQPGIENNTVFKNTAAVKAKRYKALSPSQFSALRTPTPLSVPYTIENVVPDIVKAVAGS